MVAMKQGLQASCSSVGRARASQRSSGVARSGEAVVVAVWQRTAATSASAIAGEDEGEMQGERGEVQGVEKECVATSRASGR